MNFDSENALNDTAKKIYKNINNCLWKAFLIGILCFVGLSIILLCFLKPHINFSYDIKTNFEICYISLLLNVEWWICLCMLPSTFIAIKTKAKLIELELSPYKKILDTNCDPYTLIKLLEYLLQYKPKWGPQNSIAYLLIEYLYCRCLLASKYYNKTVPFLEHHFKSKKNYIYKKNLEGVKLEIAFYERDSEKYLALLPKVTPSPKKEIVKFADYKIMSGKYNDAISLLKNYKCHSLYQEVALNYRLGLAHLGEKNYAQAKQHFLFVIEQGNNVYYKELALRLINELSSS